MVEKCDFLKVVKIPYPKNRFLVTLRSFFSTYKLFPMRGWLFPPITFKQKYFNENMSSLAGLKKKLFNFPQKYRFWPILTNGSAFKVDFLNVQAKLRKTLRQFPGGGC